jgi:hypothetical protein
MDTGTAVLLALLRTLRVVAVAVALTLGLLRTLRVVAVAVALTLGLLTVSAGLASAEETEVRCVGKQCHRHTITELDRVRRQQDREMLADWRRTLTGSADIHAQERGR